MLDRGRDGESERRAQMKEPSVRFEDPRECPHLSWDGKCFEKNTYAVCPHCFQNRLLCKGNTNRHKNEWDIRRAVVGALCLLLCGGAYADNNLQVWTQENVSYSITNGFSATLSQENRIGLDRTDNKKHIDEIHIAPSLDYRIVDWMSVGVNYRHVLLRNGSDTRYTNDRRPGLDVAFNEKVGNVSLLNRSRFICRIPEGENPYFRYRNLSKVAMSLGAVSPYVSYEWYFDEGSKHRPYRKGDKFSQQWLTFGMEWNVCHNLKLAGYYMLTENKDRNEHDWYPGHVVGIVASVGF